MLVKYKVKNPKKGTLRSILFPDDGIFYNTTKTNPKQKRIF